MSSLIANKVETNKAHTLLFSLLMCHCWNLYHAYNKNYLFITLICLQHFCKTQIPKCSLHSQLHTRLTQFLLTVVRWLLSGSFIYARLQSAERSQSRRFMISLPGELYRESSYMCILILVYPACLLLLVYLQGVWCIC